MSPNPLLPLPVLQYLVADAFGGICQATIPAPRLPQSRAELIVQARKENSISGDALEACDT